MQSASPSCCLLVTILVYEYVYVHVYNMEGQLVQRCYFRYVIQSNVACYFRYVTLRLRITVFEQVGLPYVYTFTMRVCSYVHALFVLFSFFF